jgi:hypothetical protein
MNNEQQAMDVRDHKKVKGNMHCHGTGCTRKFYMGLTFAGGQKLECFLNEQNL